MKLKIGIALITTLGLLFGTVGIANAKTATPLHKNATHITQKAKTNHKATSFSKLTQKVTIKQTAKKASTTKPLAAKKASKKIVR